MHSQSCHDVINQSINQWTCERFRGSYHHFITLLSAFQESFSDSSHVNMLHADWHRSRWTAKRLYCCSVVLKHCADVDVQPADDLYHNLSKHMSNLTSIMTAWANQATLFKKSSNRNNSFLNLYKKLARRGFCCSTFVLGQSHRTHLHIIDRRLVCSADVLIAMPSFVDNRYQSTIHSSCFANSVSDLNLALVPIHPGHIKRIEMSKSIDKITQEDE